MTQHTIQQSVYTEDFPLFHIKPDQLLALAARAAAYLQWRVVSVTGNSITYQTEEFPQQQYITLHIAGKDVKATATSFHHYYHDDAVSKTHIAHLKSALTQLAAAHLKADRNMNPIHREKWGALVPSKSYLITPIIVYINTLLFIAMSLTSPSFFHPSVETLIAWGGNSRALVQQGAYEGLFTSMFIHAGPAHILGNTFALLYIGLYLEPLIGKFRFAAAYILSGVGAAVLSMVIHTNSVSVGASGAIFGMYGVFLALLTTNYIQKTMRKTMLRSLLFFIVYNLMMGLQGNTDNAAHIGGLLAGLVIGYSYYPGILKHASMPKQVLTTLALAIGTIATVYLGIRLI